ncbi:FtsK/SpoIIIE domain-containing protein [Nocardioides pinisoli]|uniref:FtsK/SpoIIIE domain-containing protein n=1 Tax=Nocardioides pinisoli TaxID=2950279 RepID=A0ABT1KSP6_9ACTN|nr:FtsK/SpoIIIE domain-containing protein [Nocardioides pinisoli]MCP3420341.1 FtsK/SpoIIIE domain-containing protein [Nocardioides pinisoli]
MATKAARAGWRLTFRTAFRVGIRLCRLSVGCLFGWWGDLAGNVNPDPGLERIWEQRVQMASAIFWPSLAVWLAAGAPHAPGLLVRLAEGTHAVTVPLVAWAVLTTLFACTVVMRRVLAAKGYPWRLDHLARGTLLWLRFHPTLIAVLAAGCVALPAWWLTSDRGESPLGHAIPAVTALVVAAAVAVRERRWRRTKAALTPRLSAACEVPERVITEEAVLMPLKRDRGFQMVKVPPRVVDRIAGIEDRVAAHLSHLEVVTHRHDHLKHVTSLAFREVSDIELERRALVNATGGLVWRLDPVDEPAPGRPDEHIARLTDSVSPTRGGRVDVGLASLGFSIVEWTPDADVANVAKLSPQVLGMRSRLRDELGLRDPWELELRVEPSVVEVLRGPALGGSEKRIAKWRELSSTIFPADDGERWVVDDRAQDGTVLLRRVPDLLRQVQNYPWNAPVSLNSLPFGVCEDGTPLTLGLLELNMLFGGTPGGGKSGGLTALLCGIARLENVALIGLDPKRVEQAPWVRRFSRIAKTDYDATDVLVRLRDEMERRYEWLERSGLKKFGPEQFTKERPLLVLVVDELADLVAVAVDREEKAAETERSTLIRRIIAKGRAAGIVTVQATQKPQSDVVPTALRDLTQMRVAYATTNPAMTDTILGAGMAQQGGEAHMISAKERGVCFVVNETSRTPRRARTYWVPDKEVEGIAERYAHLRVDLPWLVDGPTPKPAANPAPPTTAVDVDELVVTMDDLDAAFADDLFA